jgi:hypothetical protein
MLSGQDVQQESKKQTILGDLIFKLVKKWSNEIWFDVCFTLTVATAQENCQCVEATVILYFLTKTDGIELD